MTRHPSKSVLVVDDDHDMVETLCDILELGGWTTLRAYDGVNAVSLATSNHVDWVLMDIRMPHMDGMQALAAIRRARPDQRVVLMTAFASPEVRGTAALAGNVQLIKKPFEPAALFAALE
jgi:CheY-like chemotaxis protein